MPRPPRITPAGFVFHVLNRATEGLVLFQDQADYLQFYRLLVEGARRFAVRIIAWSLMPTHWHLVLWPSSDRAVPAFLHPVTTRQSLHYRWQTHTAGRGHVYQDRYQSFPVQTEIYYYNVLRYVEANALKAGLVERAEDWPWSSLFERVHGSELIVPGPLPLPADWIQLVNRPLPDLDVDAIRRCARSGRPYGNASWMVETAACLGLERTLHGEGRPATPKADRSRENETDMRNGARPQKRRITIPSAARSAESAAAGDDASPARTRTRGEPAPAR